MQIDTEYTSFFKTYDNKNKQNVDIDCYVGKGGSWSPCGCENIQQRERLILLEQHNNGILCPDLIEFNNCTENQILIKGFLLILF